MQGDTATFRNGADLRIGFLGGGQLGRMTIQAALDLDYRIHILDPDPQCPCAGLPTSSPKATSTMPKRSSLGPHPRRGDGGD